MPAHRLFTPEQERLVLETYPRLKGMAKTAKETNLSFDIVRGILERNNVFRHYIPYSSPEQQKEMLSLYKQGLSCKKIGNILGYSSDCVLAKLKQMGHERRTVDMSNRKYKLNHDMFKSPESWTEIQAYWFGWLYTDGHNCEKLRAISLYLQERDRNVLERLRRSIEYKRELRYVVTLPKKLFRKEVKKDQNVYDLTLFSKTMSRDLANLGIVTGKGYKMDFPYWMKEDLIPHFLRGCFEGDGHYCINKHDCAAGIICGKKFAEGVNKSVESLGITFKTYGKTFYDGQMVQISLHGSNRVLRFMDFVYSNINGLFLDRKYQKFIDLVEFKKTIKVRDKALLERASQTIKENEQTKNRYY